MVSGFLISPWLQARIRSGLAIEIRSSSKVGVPCGWPSTLIRSVIFGSYGFVGRKIDQRGGRPRSRGRLVEFDVEAERAKLLDQHVEGLGDTRLERVVAAHDGLVDLGAAGHVVRLDGQDLLQRVGGAIGLK